MRPATTARRRLQQSWSARDYAGCSAILAEAFPAGGDAPTDPATLTAVAHALRTMTADAAGPTEAAAFAPFATDRAALLQRAANGNNALAAALKADAVAAHENMHDFARTLMHYAVATGSEVGARREQIWEKVVLVDWAVGLLLRHCELDQLCTARLFITLLVAHAHLSWERGAPSILKLVMQEDRARLQDGFVTTLARLAATGGLTEPEAFLPFDSDGRLLDILEPAIRPFGVRHPNSAALAYFRVHGGALPVDDFLAQIADVPCMLVGAQTCFIVAGEFLPGGLMARMADFADDRPRSVHLTWWLNVDFPREQLGDTGFIVSRIPPFVRLLLAHGKATLVLAATGEAAWFGPRWVGWLDGLAQALSCRPAAIAYLTQNTRFADEYRAHAAAHGLPTRVATGSLNTHLLIEPLKAEPLPAAPTRHFLCINQRSHRHRTALLLAMARDRLLDQTFMSFNQAITAEEPLCGDVLAPWLSEPPDEVDALIERIEPSLPLRLDLAGHGVGTSVDAGYVGSFNARLFAEAAIYLVTETEMEGAGMCRFTEKTVKGLAAEIPFLVFGSCGVLAQLRGLGFRTFAPLIDESYDAIVDPVARFKAAYAEVRRLAAMPLAAVSTLRQVLQPVLQHNRAHFLTIGARLNALTAVILEGADFP